MLAGQPMITNLKLEKPLCIIDLETTGIDTQNDRIVEISILKLCPDLPSEHKTRRINPGVPIPAAASEVHKIYDHDVASCPRFEDYAQGILNFIGDSDLCGFNLIRFDLKILIHDFLKYYLFLMNMICEYKLIMNDTRLVGFLNHGKHGHMR